jgi:phosphoesterase RecJ-like protein
LSIQGIKLAALIIDRNEEVKLSFRSKGNFDVNSFARKYFEGEGISMQPGEEVQKPWIQTVQRFMIAVKDNQSQLQ